jgi:F0F1-type ATP synthase epsilon subunit|eukprot:TRINITY_DN3429_c2_g7_i1.p2 TRINITY_DN3429_c2_g7~~TRINITY_DN3429_c2_g7_i1.p2  ORF type:complete len:181 (-),score=97.91 TRINITY_DN3429_c2_g7_i1:121-612(-)
MLRTSIRRLADAAEGGARALKVSLLCPHKSLGASVAATRITLPGTNGYFALEAGAPDAVAQLVPGVVTVEGCELPLAGEGAAAGTGTTRLFASGGFALMTRGEARVSLVEAFPVAEIDVERARAGLAEAAKGYEAAQGEQEKARLGVNVEIHQAMVDACQASA